MCDPYAAYYADPADNTTLRHLPLCPGLCNAWYNACKSDYTCYTSWVSDENLVYNASATPVYSCANTSQCRYVRRAPREGPSGFTTDTHSSPRPSLLYSQQFFVPVLRRR